MAIEPKTAVELFGSLSALLRTTRAIAQRGRESGATSTSLGVLKTLQHGDLRPGDLATGLHVVPSVISRAVAPLEQEGLLERKVDPADARASLLGLTDLGRERVERVQRVFVDQLSQTLDGWTDDEAAQAAAVLFRLEQAFSSYRQPDSHRHQLTEALLPDAGATPLETGPPETSPPDTTPPDSSTDDISTPEKVSA
ncbi:MAG: MarR family transcriptional regulator [Propionibacteriaceae bacterium]